ncbi:MAG: YdcF family protein [Vicinamibacterales bacterium]
MKRLLVRSAFILAPVVILAIFALSRLGSFLVVEDPLAKADAIFVLGGTRYERPLEAVELFHAGWAPRITLMRQISDNGELDLTKRGVPYRREVDEQIDVLVRLGVPQSAITVLNEANSTAAEADTLYAIATQEHWTRAIIVTSKQHTRRAKLVMRRRLAGTGTDVVVRASRLDDADVEHWWRSRSTLRFTLFESQRLLAYWVGVAD